ncbi:putative exported protein, partial [Yersinia pestis PY-15]
MNGEDRQRS